MLVSEHILARFSFVGFGIIIQSNLKGGCIMDICENLKHQIDLKREEMHDAYLVEKNYSKCVTKSQELDLLINKFMRICK
ncbi:Spo0E family sporulation regulatory protein-aspartic acid phosphatase [Halobacillus kuroshimensis]